MKILYVNCCKGWGGAEEVMMDLAIEMRNIEKNIYILAKKNSIVSNRFKKESFIVYEIDPKNVLKSFIEFHKIAKREQFDIIHCHRVYDLPYVFLLKKNSLILTQHHYNLNKSLYYKILYNIPDMIICVSNYVLESLIGILNDNKKMRVIYNGVKILREKTYENFKKYKNFTPILVSVGAFYKNQEFIIDITYELKKKYPKIALLLVGKDQKNKDRILSYINKKNLIENVFILEDVDRENMQDLLSKCDIYVHAFKKEGLSLSLIESLLSGTPAVVFDSGGVSEIVNNGFNGFKVNSEYEFIEKLKLLIEDKDLRKRLGQNAMEIEKSLVFKNMIEQYRELYLELKKNNI